MFQPVMTMQINGMAPLLQVFDKPWALAFYRDIPGFEIVCDSGDGDNSDWVWLRLNGVDLMLNGQYERDSVPAEPPKERVKWHSDTSFTSPAPTQTARMSSLHHAELTSIRPRLPRTGYGSST
jgi:glyoxylase I family protein